MKISPELSGIDVTRQRGYKKKLKAALALSRAARRGCMEDIRQLIKDGADVNFDFSDSDYDETSPLLEAAHKGHVEAVRLILEHIALTNPTSDNSVISAALGVAASTSKFEVVRILLEHGADIECRSESASTPLFYAASKGVLKIVKHLLEKGADVNASNNFGKTPLTEAVLMGHAGVTRLLLEHGAQVDVEMTNFRLEDDGKTPLILAVRCGRPYKTSRPFQVVKLLLDYGANINHKSQKGRTALMEAAIGGTINGMAAAYVLTSGGFKNGPPYGCPSEPNTEIVQFLLEHKVDVWAKDIDGNTALSLAWHEEVQDLLKKAMQI